MPFRVAARKSAKLLDRQLLGSPGGIYRRRFEKRAGVADAQCFEACSEHLSPLPERRGDDPFERARVRLCKRRFPGDEFDD